MDRFTYDRLAELGAPLAPLDDAPLHLVATRTGNVWHWDDKVPRATSTNRPTCARGATASNATGAKRRTISAADTIREELQRCDAYGCGSPGPTSSYLTWLSAIHGGLREVDRHISTEAWGHARTAVASLADRAQGRMWTSNHDDIFTADVWATAREWAQPLVDARQRAVTAGLARTRHRSVTALAAFDVTFTDDDLERTGARRPYAHVARHAWITATERLLAPEGISAHVHNDVQHAATIEHGDDAAIDTGPYLELCDALTERAAATQLGEPTHAVIGRVPVNGAQTTGSTTKWAWAVAATLYDPVTVGDRCAMLLPERVTERIRTANLLADTPDTDIVHLGECNPGHFAELAELALSLWTPLDKDSALGDPRTAWETATALHTHQA